MLLRGLIVFLAALGLTVPLGMLAAEAAAKKAPVKKKPAAKTAVARKSAPAAKTTAAKKAPAARPVTATASKKGGKSTARKGKKRPSVTWRNRQTVPTPERYREIQDALAQKGFLPKDEATGTWGASSVDALKRFQSAQNLEATGRIDSLSLIALGLGPKHDATASAALVPKPASP
jgi:peptidoglycan hydrolase-like protein with peptidoglycan-binding domain